MAWVTDDPRVYESWADTEPNNYQENPEHYGTFAPYFPPDDPTSFQPAAGWNDMSPDRPVITVLVEHPWP